MACPALPTCGLAVAESERAIPGLLDELEAELDGAGAARRAAHGADDRLPQRLRPPLHRGPRVRGPLARPLQRLRRRGARRGPAGRSLSRADVPTRGPARARCGRCWRAGPPSGDGDEGLGDFYQRILGRSERAPARHRPGERDRRAGADRGGAVKALVLAAHGSRRDPAANALVRRLAETVRAPPALRRGRGRVPPGRAGFDAVLDELASDEVTVVPVMTSAGHYCDVVLPAGAGAEPPVRRGPAADHAAGRARIPGMAALVARRVSELLREHGARPVRDVARCWWDTAPGATRRAAPPRWPWPTRCGAGGSRERSSPASSMTIRRWRRPSRGPGVARSWSAAVPHRRRRARAGGHPHGCSALPDAESRTLTARGRSAGRRSTSRSAIAPGPRRARGRSRAPASAPAAGLRRRGAAHLASRARRTVHLVGAGPGDPGTHHRARARPAAPGRRRGARPARGAGAAARGPDRRRAGGRRQGAGARRHDPG